MASCNSVGQQPESSEPPSGEKLGIYDCRNKHLRVHLRQLQPSRSPSAMETHLLDSFTMFALLSNLGQSELTISSENIKKLWSNGNIKKGSNMTRSHNDYVLWRRLPQKMLMTNESSVTFPKQRHVHKTVSVSDHYFPKLLYTIVLLWHPLIYADNFIHITNLYQTQWIQWMLAEQEN